MNQQVQPAGRRRLGLLTDMQQGLTQPAPPRISIKAQRFTLVDAAGVMVPVNLFDQGDPQRQGVGVYLDVIIIGVNPNKSKIYYEYDYDPTKDEPPTCFSDNGVAPSAQAAVPQSPTCAMCPNNAWGSDVSKITGKGTKACSDRKKLAVLVVNDPAQLVYQFQVPPASLKNLAVLAETLGKHQTTDEEGPRPTGPADVVTRIYFNPKKQGELLFQPMGYHEQMYPYIDPLIERAFDSGSIDMVTGKNDVPYQGAIALPNPQVMQALPAPAQQQVQAPPPPPPAQFQQPQVAPPQQQPGFAPQPGAPQFQQAPQANGQQAPAPSAPAPRTRRGGTRAGAGRPPQGQAPQQAPQPQAAPFQQQGGPQPGAPFAPAPTAAPPHPPQQGFAPPASTQPSPSSAPQPAPFQMHAAPPAQEPEGIPPFLQRAQPTPFVQTQAPVGTPVQPAAVAPGAPAGAPAFGMMNAPAPDPALAASLANAFGAPMQPRQR